MTLGDCEVVYCVYDAKVVVIDYLEVLMIIIR
jgi:hypothetical protein